jgi:Na+/proline symporter
VGLSIAGVAYGALLGVFLLGTLTKQAKELGAIVGLVTGFALNVALWMQKAPLEVGHGFLLPVIAYPWYVPIGSMVTFTVGYGVSLLDSKQVSTTN